MRTSCARTTTTTLENTFFFNKEARERRAEDTRCEYNETILKIIWGRDLKLTRKAYDMQLNRELRRQSDRLVRKSDDTPRE